MEEIQGRAPTGTHHEISHFLLVELTQSLGVEKLEIVPEIPPMGGASQVKRERFELCDETGMHTAEASAESVAPSA